MFITDLQLTKEKFREKEIEFEKIIQDDELLPSVRLELSLFFKNLTTEQSQKYFNTYWLWFTHITWDRLSETSKDDFVEFVDRQLIMALFLGFDVWKELMNYFVLNSFSETYIKNLYENLRNKIINSEEIVGEEKGKTVRLKDLVEMVRQMNKNASTLDKASRFSQIEKIIFVGGKPTYLRESSQIIIKRLEDTIRFFLEIETSEIWNIVFIYTEEEYHADAKKILFDSDYSIKNQTISKSSLSEIKKQIEDKYKKNKEGQFVDLEGVHNELQSIANEENDERIRDLYFFNEQTGKFEWNDKLIEEEGYVGTK